MIDNVIDDSVSLPECSRRFPSLLNYDSRSLKLEIHNMTFFYGKFRQVATIIPRWLPKWNSYQWVRLGLLSQENVII